MRQKLLLRPLQTIPYLLEGILATNGLVLSNERKIALLKAAKSCHHRTLFKLEYCLARPEKYPLMHEAYTTLHQFL